VLDWELKASPTPYDTLQELAFEYSLGPLRDVINLEVVAFNVVGIDGSVTPHAISAYLVAGDQPS
jgi:hypothetical protein